MKRFLPLILALLLAAFIGPPASGAAPADSTFDHSSYSEEGATYVVYTGTVDMADDSIGTHFTQAVAIGEANGDTAFVRMVAADDADGTEDINVYVEYSIDLKNWDKPGSGVVYDALGTTAVWDTASVAVGNPGTFAYSKWLRLRFVGQTGNPGTTVTWYLYVPKNANAPPTGSAAVKNRKT